MKKIDELKMVLMAWLGERGEVSNQYLLLTSFVMALVICGVGRLLS